MYLLWLYIGNTLLVNQTYNNQGEPLYLQSSSRPME
jgi:hypothetical protein